MSSPAVATVEAALRCDDDADDILRATVAALAAEPRVDWAGIAFLEGGTLVLGPEAGKPDEMRRASVPVVFEGEQVGELLADGEPDPAVLKAIASLIGPYVLIGWDTGGEPWDP